MRAILLVFTAVFIIQTPIHAESSIEGCPPDSVISEDICKCDPQSCTKPPCLSELQLATNGSDLPGKCCPFYECIGCKEEDKINEKCPCGKGAVINEYRCECVDESEHLVNGECVCNPRWCPLPNFCDKKSVAVSVVEGCCKKTVCKPCPFDSESTNLQTDELEDHCVCLPCKTECGFNKTVIIKKHGTGFPGTCCDLYECEKTEEIKGCSYDGRLYENGKEWHTQDLQVCRCNNGLSFCSTNNHQEKEAASCFVDNQLYKDSESWYKDDGCTSCECINGVPRCIAHYCDVKENLVHMNHSCIRKDEVHGHTETWIEKDGCTRCTCTNGIENCTSVLCSPPTTTISIDECQPLVNCNKTCLYGFKINKKGCEVCKCNPVRFLQDILTKYNISINELIKILENNSVKHSLTTPATTSTTSTGRVSTITEQIIDIDNREPPTVILNRHAEFLEEPPTTTTTEPTVRPTDKEPDYLIYILILGLVSLIFVVCLAIVYVYKSRRKSSIDLSNCHYETVSTHNNNNTIKKTDQLL